MKFFRWLEMKPACNAQGFRTDMLMAEQACLQSSPHHFKWLCFGLVAAGKCM
jgi:hypothetical protein